MLQQRFSDRMPIISIELPGFYVDLFKYLMECVCSIPVSLRNVVYELRGIVKCSLVNGRHTCYYAYVCVWII